MNKLHLAGGWLAQNHGRPSGRLDFDVLTGSNIYHQVDSSDTKSVWKTSFAGNTVALIFSPLLWALIIFVYYADLGYSGLDAWLKIVLGIIAVMVVLATLAFSSMIFYHKQLIIDYERNELRYCGWNSGRAYCVINRDEIRAMSFENVYHSSSSDEYMHERTVTRFLVGELNDGRLVSLAISPPAGLFEAITGWSQKDMQKSDPADLTDE